MTPEQQIREALDWYGSDPANEGRPAELALAALDRLVAERDEARRDYIEATQELAADLAQARTEANEAEGREAALREALTQIVSACRGFGPARAPVLVIARAALAGVPVDEGGGS